MIGNKMSKVNNSHPSICIPRVFANITKRDVRDVFEKVLENSSCIDRVDLISRTTPDGTPYGRVYVHFRFWPKTEQAQSIRESLLAGNTVKIVYDDPWFWKCSESRVAKPEFTRERPAPYVEIPSKPRGEVKAHEEEEVLYDAAGLPLLRAARQRQSDSHVHFEEDTGDRDRKLDGSEP